MSLKVNVNLYPKAGYHFKESDGTDIRGGTWKGVIARVRAYRARNKLPMGNVEAEVMESACRENPGYCTEENAAYKAQVRIASLKGRVLGWFANLRASAKRAPLGFVDAAEKDRRKAICKTCPRNQVIQESCSSCRKVLEEFRGQILGPGRPTESSLIQHACDALGSDLPTEIWLDQITVESDQLPGHCWRKKTL